MTRRCLICANLNPCREHSAADQDAELARNDAEIARIRAAPEAPPLPQPASVDLDVEGDRRVALRISDLILNSVKFTYSAGGQPRVDPTCRDTIASHVECAIESAAKARADATHRCKVCGALWIKWPDGTWSLKSASCGQCCDNIPMVEQIEPLDQPTPKGD